MKMTEKLRCIENKQKIKEISMQVKKGNLTPVDIEWLQKRVTDSRWMSFELMSMLDDIKKNWDDYTPELKLKIIDAYGNAQAKIHGNRQQIDIRADITIDTFKSAFKTASNEVVADFKEK